ncbi:hypothetical protein [Streptomyces sp. NPDC127039]|uniref:hypothetical protein n=1 Tax=Streptomyces sp. NPDC127039 TaxID=3347115 RepID=UPI00365C19F0
MTWPLWSTSDQSGLARYVVSGAEQLLTPGLDRRGIGEGPGGPLALARALYGQLALQGLYYDVEGYTPSDHVQRIRTPAEILGSPGRRGTCLDLALLYAGLLLDYELLPVVVAQGEHAVTLVCRDHGLREWAGYRPGYEEFQGGVVRDPSVVRALVESHAFVPVECTGFARLTASPEGRPPEGRPELHPGEDTLAGSRRTDDGLLDFDTAVDVARRRILAADRPTTLAFDVAIMRHHGIEPWQPPVAAPQDRAAGDRVVSAGRAVGELTARSRHLLESELAFLDPGPGHPATPANVLKLLEDGPGVLLTGPAGAGKTRTLLEVAALAELDDWRVLYVRPDSETANTHVERAVLAEPAARTLLLVDYLEVCAGLDLPGLLERIPALQIASGHFAVLATSRQSRVPHLVARGAVDDLTEVELCLGSDYHAAIAERIFASVAPLALGRLGPARMAEICGHRPVIALLIAQDAERRIRAGKDATPGRGPSRLMRWLRASLVQDGVVPAPRAPGDDADWLSGGDDIRHSVRACALAAAACPLPKERLETLVQPVLDEAPRAGRARALIDNLLVMGWFEQVGDRLDVTHDLVSDELLGAVVVPRAGLRVRDTELTGLLDRAVDQPDVLDHLAGNAARLYGELARTAQRDQFGRTCREWITARAGRIGEVCASAPEGGHTLYTLLHAEPWQSPVGQAWDTVVEPWLRTAVPDADRSRFLRYALAGLPAGEALPTITAALVWLAGNTTAVEPVLAGLLWRTDLDHAQRAAAARRAQTWAASDAVETADDVTVVLRGLLAHPTGTTDLDRRSVEVTADWFAGHATALPAGFVVRPLLEAHLLTAEESGTVTDDAVRWLSVHGAHPRVRTVLPVLLSSPRLSAGQQTTVVAHSLAWLESHLRRLPTAEVFRPLFARLTPRNPQYERLLLLLETWLAAHPDHPDAAWFLTRLLLSPGVSREATARHLRTAADWFDTYGDTLAQVGRVQLLLTMARCLNSATGDGEPAAAVLDCLVRQLVESPGKSGIGLRQELARGALRDAELHDAFVARARHALADGRTGPGAVALLNLLFETAATPLGTDRVQEAALDWLAHRTELVHLNVLSKVVERPLLSDERREQAVAVCLAWIERHPDNAGVVAPLAGLFDSDGLSASQAEIVHARAQEWVRTMADPRPGGRLSAMVLRSPVFPAERRVQALDTLKETVERLGVDAGVVLHDLVTGWSYATGPVDVLWFVLDWIGAHPATPTAQMLLRRLVSIRADPDFVHAAARHALERLRADAPGHDAPLLLRALIGGPWMLQADVEAAAVLVRQRAAARPHHAQTLPLLRVVLNSSRLGAPHIRWAAQEIIRGAHRAPSGPDIQLLATVANSTRVDPDTADEAADGALTRLGRLPAPPTTVKTLHALLGSTRCSPACMGRIGVAALHWVRSHPSPDGSDLKLLTAVLSCPRVPAAVLSQAADTARARLNRAEDAPLPANPAQLARLRKVLGQRAHAVALPATVASLDQAEADIAASTSYAQVRAALRNNKLDSVHADRAVRLAARWVEHHHDQPASTGSGQRRLLAEMLQAAIGNTRATPEAVAPLLPTALSWLADQEPGADQLARSVLGSPNAGAARAEAADWLLRRAEAAPAVVSPHLLRALLSQSALPDAVRQRTEDLTLAWLPAHFDHAAWPAVAKALLVTLRGDTTRSRSDVLVRSVLHWAEGHHESPHTGPLFDILVRHCEMGEDLYGTAAGAALAWVLRNRHEKHAPRILAALVSSAPVPPSVRTPALEVALAHLRAAPRHHNDHIRLLRALIGATGADGATVDEAAELALSLLPGAGPVWTPQLLKSLVSSPMSGPDVISRATGAAEDWLAEHPGDPAAASVLDALVTSPRTDPEHVRHLRENAAERSGGGAPGLG